MVRLAPIFYILSVIQLLAQTRQASTSTGPDFDALLSCLRQSTGTGHLADLVVLRDSEIDALIYEELNYQWSTLYGRLAPFAYFLPTSTVQVAAAVRCCTHAGVRVVARSGGHSYLKHSFGDANSLVVDLQRMNAVSIFSEGARDVARIDAGTRGGKIQHDLWAARERGLLLPTGMCPQVGIAGFSLGGGYGFYARHYGLATDNLLELELVNWEGAQLTVNNVTDPDLFWALRGGGAGSFGIVTEMTFNVHEAPNAVVVGDVGYDFKDFGQVFTAWQKWLASEPPSHVGMWASFGATYIGFQFFSTVQDPVEGAVELAAILATWLPPPSSPPTIRSLDYPDWIVEAAQSYTPNHLTAPADLVNVTRLAPPRWVKIKSFFVDKFIAEPEIDELQALLLEMAQHVGLVVEQYGGAIAKVAKQETAFIHRGVHYEAQFRVNSDDGEQAAAVEAMKKFFEGTKAVFQHTESYQNYLDEDLDNWMARYYGDAVGRLMAVKARVDPHNVFHNPRSIPVGRGAAALAVGSSDLNLISWGLATIIFATLY